MHLFFRFTTKSKVNYELIRTIKKIGTRFRKCLPHRRVDSSWFKYETLSYKKNAKKVLIRSDKTGETRYEKYCNFQSSFMTNLVWRHWLKNRSILLIYSHYQSIIGQYFHYASTRQVFFCPLKDNNSSNHDIDGVDTGIESSFLKR